jgi:hypothetical protein
MHFHLGMNITGITLVGSFVYSTNPDEQNIMDRCERFSFEERLKDHDIPFSTREDGFDLMTSPGLGLLCMKSFKQDVTNRPVILPMQEANYGMNTEIEYCAAA